MDSTNGDGPMLVKVAADKVTGRQTSGTNKATMRAARSERQVEKTKTQ
jgi:hypothetical protein